MPSKQETEMYLNQRKGLVTGTGAESWIRAFRATRVSAWPTGAGSSVPPAIGHSRAYVANPSTRTPPTIALEYLQYQQRLSSLTTAPPPKKGWLVPSARKHADEKIQPVCPGDRQRPGTTAQEHSSCLCTQFQGDLALTFRLWVEMSQSL